MKSYCMGMLVCSALLVWAGAASAHEDLPLDLSSPAQGYAQKALPLMLAENASVVRANAAPAVAAQPEFDPPLLTGSNMHLVLGLATLLGAAATAVSPPSDDNTTGPRNRNGFHGTAGKVTGALAAATVASGFVVHWNDFHLEDGWSDPDNLHVILGATGASMLGYAVLKSAGSSTKTSHAALAELGAVGMLIGVKLTW